jgi:hypothetical protein
MHGINPRVHHIENNELLLDSTRARKCRSSRDCGQHGGVSDALPELQQSGYPGEGFAADGRLGCDPAAARLYGLQFPLHHLRARAVA